MTGSIKQFVLLIFFAGLATAHAANYSMAGANRLVGMKDWNRLLQYCMGWTKAEPNNPMSWYYMGNTYGGEALNQPKNALPAFQRAAALKSPWPEVWNALGHVYAQLGRYGESADAFKRATEQNPKKIYYWNSLAAAYTDANKWDLALKALDDGQQAAAPYATYADWYVLGNGFANLRQYDKAVYAYQQCLRRNSRVGEAWNNLGVVMQERGNSVAAMNDYQQAANLGDSLGTQNYAALQNTIRQAQAAAARRNQPLSPMAVQAAIEKERAAAYSANHPEASWSESMSLGNQR